MNVRLFASAVFALLFLSPAMAQEKVAAMPAAAEKGLFIGVQGGMPFGVSALSSFGADKIRIGYSAGLYCGYRFNPVLSLEAAAKWGEVCFSARQCCLDRNLWLGADGVHYNVPVLDMSGWDYGNLKSSSFTQDYLLQLNVNILGFFSGTKHGRWTLEVSPMVAAVGTKAAVKTISDGVEVISDETLWHLGAGGNLHVGCRVTKLLNISFYSGITCLSGDSVDGIPEYIHKSNCIWESGLRLGFMLWEE